MYVLSVVHDPVKEHLIGWMLSKPHTVCNCFSVHCNHKLKLFMCIFKSLSFVLIVQTLPLSWGLINIMSTRSVSGLKCDARGHEAPKGGAIYTGYISNSHDMCFMQR